MHDNPAPTPEEHEQVGTERHVEEEAMVGPGHEDPERPFEEDGGSRSE